MPYDRVLAPRLGTCRDAGEDADALLRYTRLMFTEYLKKRMQDHLGYGLAMERLALMEQVEPPK